MPLKHASNLILRQAKMTLGNSKQNCSWQYRTMFKFEVLYNFTGKKRFQICVVEPAGF